jgi:hypothetical protein
MSETFASKMGGNNCPESPVIHTGSFQINRNRGRVEALCAFLLAFPREGAMFLGVFPISHLSSFPQRPCKTQGENMCHSQDDELLAQDHQQTSSHRSL